jgi:uncharacterized protein (DUF1501 family)
MTSRRHFLEQALAAGLVMQLPGLSFARASGESRLVVFILRGALDGLTAVPPHGDPDYASARRDLALAAPGATNGALPLDRTFGLHPELNFLHRRYTAKELLVVHAVASPYRERSHFDAQNLLENGTARPFGSQDGWLNRALAGLPAPRPAGHAAVALAQNVPLLLRGPASVTSWAPSALPEVEPDFIERLADLYATDERLSQRLQEATAIGALASENDMDGNMGGRRNAGNQRRLQLMAETAGKFLTAPDGPRVAVLESGGWDTHAQQGAAQGQLALRLRGLDAMLSTLADNMQPVWKQTAVLVVTEFGRTVAINGSRGTDHGTGACAFLLGGAINGGRVLADWPGLGARDRHQGRDLKPTLDLRSVCKGLLADHLRIPAHHLTQSVFPASDAVRPLPDTIRT